MLRPLATLKMEFRFKSRYLCAGFLALLLLGGCGSGAADQPAAAAGPSPGQTGKPEVAKKRIVFFGDSITAGYGLDPADAYPAVIQEKINELNWPFEVVNAGVSGETSAGGLRRIDWVLQNPVDVLVLELGANDGLRGLPVDGMKYNLTEIIKRTRKKNPDVAVVLAGMRMPPNLGRQYASDFNKAFPELAGEVDAELVPFLLDDVAGRPLLNQFDGIHPTARGQKIVADNVWDVLKPVLERKAGEEESS